MDNMKIELRHLAPYLPYRLHYKYYDPERERDTILTLEVFHDLDDMVFIDEYYEYSLTINEVKPLLIPLSELTENFLIDGIEDITNYISRSDIYKVKNEPIYYWPYGQFQRLVSWHFDVFNLIPSGLALNKNDYGK